MDYLYIVPSGLEQIDSVSPICRYIFEVMIQYRCQWYITVPIDNTMSLMKVTANMMTYKDGKLKSFLPQYTWTEVITQNEQVTSTSQEQDNKQTSEQVSEQKASQKQDNKQTASQSLTVQESFISQYIKRFTGRSCQFTFRFFDFLRSLRI